MGWHGLSTIGHFLTLCSILFFFLMLLDSMLEKKIYTHNTLGVPRFNKRINYYFFKIRYHQYMYRIIQSNLSYNQNRLLPKDVNFELYK